MSYFGFNDRVFYKQMLGIAIPMALQQLVSSSITLIDNIMIGRLTDSALAAVTHANQVTFLLFIFLFGVTSASTAFAAQYWGKGDIASIRHTMGVALVCCAVIGISFLLVTQLLAESIIGLFTNDPVVHDLGVSYLRIICFTYPLITIAHAFASILRGTENVRLPAVSAIIGIAMNAVLNYILIFGKLGFPAMGVRGAALATVIAQAVDTCIIISFSYILKKPNVDKRYKMLPVKRDFALRYARVGLPVFANESLWALAQVTTIWLYAQLGTPMSAAIGIFNVFDRMSYSVFVGLANSSAVMVGKQIGAGSEENAFTYARRFIRLTPIIAIATGILINIIAPLLLGVYEISQQTESITRHIIFIYALSLPFAVHNYMVVIGILRSGGDTRFTLIVDSMFHWLITVSLVAVGVFVLKLDPRYVYACVIPSEVIKMFVLQWRFRSKKWINNLTQ